MEIRRVYLDYNATTPVDPRVCSAMLASLSDSYGNASSREHAWGWDAADAVEQARSIVADCVGARPSEIVFTSGATEALNTAIRGFVGYEGWANKKIVVAATEHQAVLAPCFRLAERTGVEVALLRVDLQGRVDLEELERTLDSTKRTLVAIMAVNNETGTVQPVLEVARVIREAGSMFLCDVTQALGKMGLDVHASGIDLAALSAHKICGPKGGGALFVRRGEPEIDLAPLVVGGGQEHGLRGGTLNVPAIVGFGEACRIVREEWKEEAIRVARLRDRLEQELLTGLSDIWINGDRQNRIPNTSSIGFRGVDARALIRDMHDIAVSTRAACSSGAASPSHVLKAIGLTDDEAYSCIRFSLGRFTTEKEIDYTIDKVIASAHKLRRNRGIIG